MGESFGVSEPPFLLAEGFNELSGLPEPQAIYRTYAWSVPLAPSSIHPWEIDGFATRATRAESTLRGHSLFLDLSAPVAELAAARETGQVAGRRLLLVGGQVAALLLAFAVLAAVGMRRDVEAAGQRLTSFGGRRWQVHLVTVAETAAVALLGAVVGWALGSLATAALADRAGSPARAVLSHSALAGAGIAAGVGLALAAALVLIVVLTVPGVSLAGRTFTPLDAGALGALLAIILAFARGDADAQALGRGGGTGTLLLLLPGLVTFVVAVAAARLLVPGLRLFRASRAGRTNPRPARRPLPCAQSRPGRGGCHVPRREPRPRIFAVVYRSTLDDGISEQAAYAVPRDFTVREDLSPAGLVAPLEAAPLTSYEGLGAAVIRFSGVRRAPGAGAATLLGVPADAIAHLDGWRARFSPLSRSELIDGIEPTAPPVLRGAPLPADARSSRCPTSCKEGRSRSPRSSFSRTGSFRDIDLGTANLRIGRPRARSRPMLRRPGRRGLELARPLSVEGHGDFARVDGVLTLGSLTAGGSAITDYTGWQGLDNVDATGSRLRFLLSNEAANPRFQPTPATDATPPAVVATPGLAAAAGSAGFSRSGFLAASFRFAWSGRSIASPSVSGDFVLGEERSLYVCDERGESGYGRPERALARGAGRPRRRARARAVRCALRLVALSARGPPSRRSARSRLAGRAHGICDCRLPARPRRSRGSSRRRCPRRPARASTWRRRAQGRARCGATFASGRSSSPASACSGASRPLRCLRSSRSTSSR